MKIIMIGPVYPYKGGISHYTGMMCKALRKKHPTHMISYQMQYPKLLFKKEQRDYTNECFKIKNTKYWINTANPFNIIKTALQIRKLKPDLVVIQWWHPYFAPCYVILSLAVWESVRSLWYAIMYSLMKDFLWTDFSQDFVCEGWTTIWYSPVRMRRTC